MAVHRVSGETPGAVVHGKVGDEIIVAITEMSGAGYQWQFDPAPPPMLEVLPEEPTKALAPAPGASSVREIRLRITAPGEARVELAHRRPWEGAASATKRFSLLVQGM